MKIFYFREMRNLVIILVFLVFAQTSFGQRFSFLLRGIEDGLTMPVVNDLEVDATGMIWLATDGGGMVKFDGIDFYDEPALANLPSLFVTVIEKDFSNNFWIGTERGLACYNGKKLHVFKNGPEAKINGIAFLENTVYVASRQGLLQYKDSSFTAIALAGETEVLSVAVYNKEVYFTTETGCFVLVDNHIKACGFSSANKVIGLKNGLAFCSPTKVEGFVGTRNFTVDATGVRDVVWADNGTLWLASQKEGLLRVSNGHVKTIDARTGLAYDRVRTLLFLDGKLWLGAQQGLAFFQNTTSFALDESQGLPDESVHAALELNGDYWLGTATGISVFKKDGSILNYSASDGLPGGIVLDIEFYQQKVWVATEQGVAYFSQNRFHSINKKLDFVFCLKPINDVLLMGTANGVWAYQHGTTTQIAFADSLPDGIVAIENAPSGQYFVGLTGAIYKREMAGLQKIKQWQNLPIDTLQIFAAKFSAKYTCFFVVGDGVYLWQDNELTKITEKDGLASTSFKSAAIIGDRLWVTTDFGMQCIELLKTKKSNFRIQSISDLSSINNKEFNFRSLTVAGNGELLNGSNNGLFVLGNASISAVPNYQVGIQRVNLFFQPTENWSDFGAKATRWSNLPQQLELPYHQNYLSIKFNVQPNNAHDAKLYFRYKLVGQDKTWTNANGRKEAFFTSINPGKYSFEVESSANSNFSETSKAVFHFKITSPFWLTWWFWVLFCLGVLAIVIFVARYRINQLNQKLLLENALANSERKALRLQMNPHFVFNALDAISGFIFKNEAKEAVRYLGSFAKLMRITLESSRETLVPLQNEMQLLKNYIDLEQLRFNNKFSYEIEIDEELDPYDILLPPMLLQPFVENAIIHGLKHKEGNDGFLKIAFKDVDNHLLCTITDNGVGRKKSGELNAHRNKTSLATSITEERIDLLAKSLGERVIFTITDLFSKTGEATGTEVVISFPYLSEDEQS